MLSCETLSRVARVLHCVPAGLEEQALLRVHARGLARRDIEEEWIEVREALEERPPLAVTLALLDRLRLVGLIEALQLPALRRNDRYAMIARGQPAPELPNRAGLRIAAGQPDDRDAFAGARTNRSLTLDRLLDRLLDRRRRGIDSDWLRFGDLRRGSSHPPRTLRCVLGQQVLGQGLQRGEFVEHGFRQAIECRCKPPVELHDHDRVKPEALERILRFDLLGIEARDASENALQLAQHTLLQNRGIQVRDGRVRGHRRCGRDGMRHRLCRTKQPVERGVLAMDHNRLRSAESPGAIESAHSRRSLHRVEPAPLELSVRLSIDAHSTSRPQRPGDCEGAP